MKASREMEPSNSARWTLFVFIAALLIFGLTAYGGVRSPDNEVVFRAAESFASRGLLDLGPDLGDWDGFGLARGRDRNLYPIFGPLESIALAPFVGIGRSLAANYPAGAPLSPSFYVDDGFTTVMEGTPLRARGSHALRLACAGYNLLVAAGCAALFFRLAARLAGGVHGALVGTAFLAFGSLLWPYSGTYFSEPLALLLVLASILLLIRPDESRAGASAGWNRALAGAALALAISTHVSAALFAPFFGAIAWSQGARRGRSAAVRETLRFCLGVGLGLLPLATYNWGRFGNPFETGRTAHPGLVELFRYGVFTAPWRGMYGLLLAPGKGLFLFSPAVLLGIAFWPTLHRRWPQISWALGSALITRWLFIAARSDWHGGFCLGPRYLLLALPFLVLPIAVAVEELRRRGTRRHLPWLAAALFLCVAQQAAFSIGEVFRFLHHARRAASAGGVDPFAGDRLYLDWQWSPLFRLLDGERGAYLLQGVPLGNLPLWLLICGLLLIPIWGGMRALARSSRAQPHPLQAGDGRVEVGS
ncbi:MAG: hypothetical protein IPK72_11405 [Candidatus Eisenbacteria bacterium]|nr:hypothetical protein [Candidatus Eisenbacteria bacterium]